MNLCYALWDLRFHLFTLFNFCYKNQSVKIRKPSHFASGVKIKQTWNTHYHTSLNSAHTSCGTGTEMTSLVATCCYAWLRLRVAFVAHLRVLFAIRTLFIGRLDPEREKRLGRSEREPRVSKRWDFRFNLLWNWVKQRVCLLRQKWLKVSNVGQPVYKIYCNLKRNATAQFHIP